MTSDAGARIELSLKSAAESDVQTTRYRLKVIAGTDAWSGEAAVVGEMGEIVVEVDKALPTWIAKVVNALLRAAWRAAQGGAPWPRRIRRWRADPREAR